LLSCEVKDIGVNQAGEYLAGSVLGVHNANRFKIVHEERDFLSKPRGIGW